MMGPSSTRFNLTLRLHPTSNRIKHQRNTDKSKPRMTRKLRYGRHLGHLLGGVMLHVKWSFKTNSNIKKHKTNHVADKPSQNRNEGPRKRLQSEV